MEGFQPSPVFFDPRQLARTCGTRQVLFGPLGFGGPQLRFPHTLYPIVFSSPNGKTSRALIEAINFSAAPSPQIQA